MDKPNLVLPLGASYNERGVDGYASTVTNSLDQRKINSFYEMPKNATTGKVTLYLTKRPGVTVLANTFGTSGQVAYLIVVKPGAVAFTNAPWVISKNGNDIRASDESTTTVIVNSATHVPLYVDKTAVSDVNNAILQTWVPSTFVQRAFYSSSIGTWNEITDAEFAALSIRGKMEPMDGWLFALASDNYIYNSDLNSLANWTGSPNRIKKQITQDQARGLARFGAQLLVFGDETCERYINRGNASGSPLQRVDEKDVGLPITSSISGRTHYYDRLLSRMYMIGRSAGSRGTGVFSFDGEKFEKVSTPFIDKIIGDNWYSLNAIGFGGKQGIGVSLSAPDATTQRWLMFFPEWNEWFEWTSTVFCPVNNAAYFLGVGANQDRIYFFGSTDTWRDDATDFTFTHQFKLPYDGNDRKFMSQFGVIGDTARSASSLNVEFSDDDGQNWSTARAIDMTSKQKQLTRCGSYIERMVRLSHTANLEVRLQYALARIQ